MFIELTSEGFTDCMGTNGFYVGKKLFFAIADNHESYQWVCFFFEKGITRYFYCCGYELTLLKDEKNKWKEDMKTSYVAEIISFFQCKTQQAEEFELNGEEV